MVRGIQTSEFYVTVLSVIGGLAAAWLGGVDAGAIAASLSPAGIYIGGRSYVKGKEDAY